jgi:hypothetical protein
MMSVSKGEKLEIIATAVSVVEAAKFEGKKLNVIDIKICFFFLSRFESAEECAGAGVVIFLTPCASAHDESV